MLKGDNVISAKIVVIIIQLKKTTSKPDSIKIQALELYLEGLGFRSIGRFLKFRNVSVNNWIKLFGEEITKNQK